MASVQKKGDSYYCQFYFQGRRRTFTVGRVSESKAWSVAEDAEKLLGKIRREERDLPQGVDIVDFVQAQGNVKDLLQIAEKTKPVSAILTLEVLRDKYLAAHEGAQEENSLATVRMHFGHFIESFKGLDVRTIDVAKLQEHIDRRKKIPPKRSPVTLRKEMATFRAAWNWAAHQRLVEGPFPGRHGLVYPKGDEKPPYMTMAEIERRVRAGEDPKRLWDSLYLTLTEVAELLSYVKEKAVHPWIYPMFVFAAHTSARRSEMLRVEVEDVDIVAELILIKEKKRDKTKRTTRRVPLSPLLKSVLTEHSKNHPSGRFLFSNGGTAGPLTRDEVHDHFKRTLRGSKWSVLRGWHVLRHAAISALVNRGIDQRVIDSVSGHLSETERRRYSHLYPDVKRDAMRLVFG